MSLSDYPHTELSLFSEATILFKHVTVLKITKHLYFHAYIHLSLARLLIPEHRMCITCAFILTVSYYF